MVTLRALFVRCGGKSVGGALAAVLLLAGCATPPAADDAEAVAAFREVNDPLEPTNRAIFDFNLFLDRAAVKPVARVYLDVMPEPGQRTLDNLLDTIRSPIVLANDLAQGEVDRAVNTFWRILVNVTLGFFGAVDLASEMGFPRHEEDFGQTLAVWGADNGPYLMLPLIGPSNPRDALGLLVDILIDPFRIYASNIRDNPEWNYERAYATAVNGRAKNYDEIEELQRTSLDFYAATRSLYRQRRAEEIRNGRPAEIEVPLVTSPVTRPAQDQSPTRQ